MDSPPVMHSSNVILLEFLIYHVACWLLSPDLNKHDKELPYHKKKKKERRKDDATLQQDELRPSMNFFWQSCLHST